MDKKDKLYFHIVLFSPYRPMDKIDLLYLHIVLWIE